MTRLNARSGAAATPPPGVPADAIDERVYRDPREHGGIWFSAELLEKSGACHEYQRRARRLFPHGVWITPEVCVRQAREFDWYWGRNYLLSDDEASEFNRAVTRENAGIQGRIDAAKAAYRARITELTEARSPAQTAYHEGRVEADRRFNRETEAARQRQADAMEQAHRDHDAAVATARQGYHRAIAEAQRVYDEASREAYEAFDRTRRACYEAFQTETATPQRERDEAFRLLEEAYRPFREAYERGAVEARERCDAAVTPLSDDKVRVWARVFGEIAAARPASWYLTHTADKPHLQRSSRRLASDVARDSRGRFARRADAPLPASPSDRTEDITA